MQTLHTVNLVIHIASGFTSLTVGLIPMIAKKGGRVHRLAGQIFFWAMFGVFITATVSWLQQPAKPFFQFLLMIGFFSFHMALTGVRTLRMKSQKMLPARFDWLVAGVAMVGGAIALLFGLWQLYNGLMMGKFTMFSILYLLFGSFFLRNGQMDWWLYSGWVPMENRHWLYNHIIRMVGAYIASFTAFCVVNSDNIPLPSILVWTLPGMIGGVLIARTVQHYKRKSAGSAVIG
ncbi:MAG: hypothetical protein JWP57_578 [Spirosoma sp.]|nr:hypothetical protein [Spirosoma sp.]